MADLLTVIKKAAADAVSSAVPTDIVTGTVVGDDPLRVQIDAKLTLSGSALLICDSVKRKDVDMKIEEQSEAGGDPSQQTGLKTDDVVLLIRQSGGQRYVIIDRVSGL